MERTIAFVDFDGTITMEDTLAGAMKKYDDGNELLKKTDVMALYRYDRAIGIGDSFTDRNMAQAVDTVFARDVLAKFLSGLGKPYIPYEDFRTVSAAIRSSR